ncbi:hypothetical protein [Uliginosibacterium gangwonense]|uniref:hypothetical protein n=1 Tax=Uliginosibacterium gangwonense TaxID=392736 RepID=UPI00036DFA78|nr:hypothetical protein [Uliginosibacterium gangwonense]
MSTHALSPALIRALQAGRSQFNARVAEASRAQPGFDTQAVQNLLHGTLNPLAEYACNIDADRTNSFILCAFDIGLTLQLRGKAELPLTRLIWQHVLPACLPLALLQPRDTLGSLFNAALNLHTLDSSRQALWAREMARLVGRCANLANLRSLGQVLAWRCGLAHFRASALGIVRSLPAELAADALAIPPGKDLTATLGEMEANIWFNPAQPTQTGLRVVHEVGGFSGFGGPFSCPPEVRVYADGFVVRSAERYWYLSADAFGTALHAGSAEEFAAGSPDNGRLTMRGNQLQLDAQHCDLDLPAEGLQMVCGPTTAAICSPYSHFIRLLALS